MSRYIFMFTKDENDLRRLEKALPLDEHKIKMFNIQDFDYPKDITDAFLLGKELLSDETLINKINGKRIHIGPSLDEIKTGKVPKQNLIKAIEEFFVLDCLGCVEDTYRTLDKFEKAGVEMKIPGLLQDIKVPTDLSYDELKALLSIVKYLGFYRLEFRYEQ